MQPRDCTLDDGTRVHLRDIRPDDAAELKRGFEQLSPTSRYQRFLGGISSLTASMLRYLTNVDGQDHVAIVATVADGDGERGVGVGRFVRLAGEPTVAEVAITVTDELQGRGLGRTLGTMLALLARERGIEHFRGEVLVDNVLCRELLLGLGATVAPTGEGRLAFDVPLTGDDARLDATARRVLRAGAGGLVGARERPDG